MPTESGRQGPSGRTMLERREPLSQRPPRPLSTYPVEVRGVVLVVDLDHDPSRPSTLGQVASHRGLELGLNLQPAERVRARVLPDWGCHQDKSLKRHPSEADALRLEPLPHLRLPRK